MTTLTYILKVSILLTVLYLVYKVLFTRTKHTIHNRFYLLFGLVIAFLIPVIPVYEWTGTEQQIVPVASATQWVDAIVQESESRAISQPNAGLSLESSEASLAQDDKVEFTQGKPQTLNLNWPNVLFALWMVGVLVMMVKLFINYLSLYRLYRNGQLVVTSKTKVSLKAPNSGFVLLLDILANP